MNTTLMAEQLEGDYRQVFERAEMYCCTIGVATEVEEDKMMNLFDVLLTAQNNGKPVEKIVGKDIKRFCECYFEDYSIKERIRHLPCQVYRWAWVVLIFSILELLFESDLGQGFSWGFYYQTDILPYVIGISCGLVFSVIARFCMSPLIFHFPKIAPIKYYISYLVMFVAAVFVVVAWEDTITATIMIPIMPVIAVCAVYIAFYWGIRARGRYRDYGSIRKEKEQEEIRQEDSPKFLLELGESLVKKFHRKNRRRVRRGKEEWTPEEFMDYLRRQDAKEIMVWRIMAVFYAAIVAVPVAGSIIYDGIEDALILGAVLVAILVPIYRLCKKISAFGVRCRKKIMQESRSRGENLLEYVAYLREHKKNK